MARVGPQRHKKKKVICNMSMVKSRKEIMTHLELTCRIYLRDYLITC